MPDYLHIPHKGGVKKIEAAFYNTGERENPVLVFLHEGLGCVAAWKGFPQALGRMTKCNVMVYSRLGYGASDTAPLPRKINWFHTEALDLLPKILNTARVSNYIHIGHSDGGSIALIHGGRRPRGLRGIVTLAAHVFCEPITRQGVRQAARWYDTGDLRQRLERIHGQNTDIAFQGWRQTWLSPGFIHWNIEKDLKTIDVPVLAIQGSDDAYGTLDQITAMARGIRTCTTAVIDNCGHAPHLEQPRKTATLISDFIAGLL